MPRIMIATHEPELEPVSASPLTIASRLRTNVRRVMAADNVSQQELADRLTELRGRATSRESVKAILNRAAAPSIEWLELFARALGVEEGDLTADAA